MQIRRHLRSRARTHHGGPDGATPVDGQAAGTPDGPEPAGAAIDDRRDGEGAAEAGGGPALPQSGTQSGPEPDTHSDTHADAKSDFEDAAGSPGAEQLAHESSGPADGERLSDVDEWGRSDRVRSVARTLFDPVYERWFRVEWEGFDRIPREGPALLVANHAGAIPSDAPVIMHGIEKELGRPVYGMADPFFRAIPFVGTMWSRAGGVAALPDNAYRLLHDQGRLVLVFPEGTKATSKSFGDRYQLRRFGRGGFVEIAIRAGVPIVPIAVVGAEETMPVLFRVPTLARALRLPYFPVTANMAVLGPAGALVPFPAKFNLRVLDPVVLDVPPDRDHYPRSLLMEEAERIRQLLQENIDEMVAARRSVWFG